MAVSDFTKQIAKGTFWSLSGNMALKLISFFYLVILARMASQADVGIFYLALGIFGILSLLADLGLRASFVRYIPYFLGKGEKGKILMLMKFTYAASTALSIIIAAIVFFFSDFLAQQFGNPELSGILRLLSPYLLLNTFFVLNISFLNGMKDIRMRSMLSVFQNASKLVLTLALIFFLGANIFSIAVGFLLSFLAALLVSVFYIHKPISRIVPEAKKTEENYPALLRDVLPFGIMMTIITSFWVLINNTDRIMIGYFLAEEQVAIYTIATALAMLIMIFPSAIGMIFFPLVSELFGKGRKDEMISVGNTSIRWMLFIIMPLALVLLSFPDRILNMFYGAEYAVGGLVLAIFTFGLLIRSLTFMQALILAGMRLVRIELKVAAAAALTNVLLNIFLIPLYGIEGAAAASAVAFLVASILFIYYSRKVFGFSFPPEAFKAVFAGAIALAIIFLAKPYLSDVFAMLPEFGEGDVAPIFSKVLRLGVFGSLFLLAGMVYLAVLFLLKTFTEEDINLLAAAMRRAKIPDYWITTTTSLFFMGVQRPH